MIPTRQRKAKGNRAGEGMAVRLIGYARVSTDKQSREGVSMAAQRERLEAYAVAHGFVLVGHVEEAGVSGKVAPATRPGLGAALARIRRGEADGLVAITLDRISRSVRDIFTLADEAQRAGWRILTVEDSIDWGSASGRLMASVQAGMAQAQREYLAERTRMALDRVAREGRLRSRFSPFGYAVEAQAGGKPRLLEAPAEQAMLRTILDLDSDGFGARRIANALNEAGTPNPRTGRAWTFGTIAAILRTVDRRAKALASAPVAPAPVEPASPAAAA